MIVLRFGVDESEWILHGVVEDVGTCLEIRVHAVTSASSYATWICVSYAEESLQVHIVRYKVQIDG
jgi:hypothetical protein